MVTCGPIVFPKVLRMQHLQIIFDFNALDMVQIFKSMPMVLNWYKTEIAQYFYKWCFFYIYYQIENMNRKRDDVGKGSRRNSHAMWFHTAPPTQHGQNHNQSAIITNKSSVVNQTINIIANICEVLWIALIFHLKRIYAYKVVKSLQWRHNDRDSVSNHQPHDCLLNRLFSRRSMKTSKLRVTDLCSGNSPVTGDRTKGQ